MLKSRKELVHGRGNPAMAQNLKGLYFFLLGVIPLAMGQQMLQSALRLCSSVHVLCHMGTVRRTAKGSRYSRYKVCSLCCGISIS